MVCDDEISIEVGADTNTCERLLSLKLAFASCRFLQGDRSLNALAVGVISGL